VIVACAVTLHERAGQPDDTVRVASDPVVARASWVALALLAPAIVAGTVLTGTGPHGGDPEAQRFALHPPSVAQVHGVLVEVFTAALLVGLVLAWRRGASRQALTRGSVAIAVAVAQSVVGYTQYFTGVPPLLVAVHIAGATALWIAVLRFHLALTSAARVGPVPPHHASDDQASVSSMILAP
jgi:cytochrome c oxidase assembly protein subunit 15